MAAALGMAQQPEWFRQGVADLTVYHFFGCFIVLRIAFEFLKPHILAPDTMSEPEWLGD